MVIRFFKKADAPHAISHKMTLDMGKYSVADGNMSSVESERKEEARLVARRIALAVCAEMEYDFFQISEPYIPATVRTKE